MHWSYYSLALQYMPSIYNFAVQWLPHPLYLQHSSIRSDNNSLIFMQYRHYFVQTFVMSYVHMTSILSGIDNRTLFSVSDSDVMVRCHGFCLRVLLTTGVISLTLTWEGSLLRHTDWLVSFSRSRSGQGHPKGQNVVALLMCTEPMSWHSLKWAPGHQ